MKWLTLFTSLTLASTAAYFSIIGLMTIFSGAALSILVMASVLEFGKIVSAAWLHYEWERINNLVRAYFTTAVVVLMLITSMGIFGFLSKAHIDSSITSDSYSLEASIVDKRLEGKQLQLDNLTGRLENLDYVLQTSRPEDRNYVNRVQTEERNEINLEIDNLVADIVELNEQKMPIQKLQLEQEAELGPVKYIADMIYGEDAESFYDNAVRWVILTIIFVFDPLAIMLLIVSTAAFKRDREQMNPLVDEEQIHRMDKKKQSDEIDWDRAPKKTPSKSQDSGGLSTTLNRRPI
jgi:multisubunit Na+/H+ antiporter MnhC subunit